MDAQIERLISQRDYRGALDALATGHGKALGRFCAGFLGSADDGQEALQEALVQAFAAMPRYRGDGVRAWAFGIARHVCAAELRKRARRRSLWARIFSGRDPEEDAGPTAIDHVEARLTLEKAVASLSPGLRAALLLRYQQGMDLTEVGDVLGISHAAARKRISLGLRELRRRLEVTPSNLQGATPEAPQNRQEPLAKELRGEEP